MVKMKKIDRGLELWSRAKKIIPGGTMLLSKNPDRYLPMLGRLILKLLKVV